MRRVSCCVLVCLAGACSGTGYVERTPTVPPTGPLQRVAPPPSAPAGAPPAKPVAAPSAPDSEATRAWFEQEIEIARYVPPPPPPAPEPVTQVVEHVYHDGYPPPRSTFPVNTVMGAGIGAAIGCEEGAWIGGGIGLFLDLLPRW